MSAPTISDHDLATVATVAQRERWVNLASPPEGHGPRTVAEAEAVANFVGAAERRQRRTKDRSRNARIAVVVLVAVVLGACWIISPERTALALLAAGLIAFIGHSMGRRRRHRREGRSAL
ncbi:MAG: hypothetical protein ACR2N6_02390 [Miltoncostaeaceae bacterium]